MKRPTITDIAREAGVSKGAVSYALNGRPGVSEATRHRITRIARELGWSPSSTARALSGGRTGTIGLVLDGPADLVVPALLDEFSPELLVQLATGQDAVLAVYRRWRAERKVDGVLLTGLACAAELVRIGLPAAVLGGPGGLPGVPSVRVDDRAGAAEALEYLAALGHRYVVRIAGPAAFADAGEREEAFAGEARRVGLAVARTAGDVVGGWGNRAGLSGLAAVGTSDWAGGSRDPGGTFKPATAHPAVRIEPSADAVRNVLATHPRPTALLCDTDSLAVAALVAARELGLAVPGDLSVVSWDDSDLCRLVRPALSAVRRPLPELGGLAASMLRDLIAGEDVGDSWTSRPRLITRGSTGPAH